jgi:hypothetical protein
MFNAWRNNAAYWADSGYCNICNWVTWPGLGLEPYTMAFSLVALVAWGIWLYFHRGADLWTLLGATSIVARMITYHRLYDDIAVYLAVLALHRIWRGSPPFGGTPNSQADKIMILLICSLEFRVTGPHLSDDLGLAMETLMGLTWLLALAFLMKQAKK